VKLPVLGTYSATAPYDCPKSRRILEQGCKVLAVLTHLTDIVARIREDSRGRAKHDQTTLVLQSG